MKIRPMGADLFHADGGTERHGEAKWLSSILRTSLKTATERYEVLKERFYEVRSTVF